MQISSIGSPVSGQLTQFGFRTTRTSDLSIVTAEGDTVTLSTNSMRAVGFAGASGSAGGTRLDAAALQLSSSDSVSLSVDGNLNKQELADLKKVITAFEKAAAKGDARQFLESLSHGNLDTIKSVTGSASVETVVETMDVSATAAPLVGNAPSPAAPPAPPAPPATSKPEGERPAAGQQTAIGDFTFLMLSNILFHAGAQHGDHHEGQRENRHDAGKAEAIAQPLSEDRAQVEEHD
ncbi:MAG TPA: hypothetical protein VGK32_04740 [Vicinamibacterales bacterium]|jgi:hypothetical protein